MIRCCLLPALLLIAAAPAPDGKVGAWDLDLAASRLAGAPPRSDVRIYEDAGDGLLRSTHTVVDAAGREAVTVYAARDDGKPYAMRSATGADLGTIALTRRDRFSQDFVTVRDGRETGRGRTTLSRDGRTLTMRIMVATAAGPREILTMFRRRASR